MKKRNMDDVFTAIAVAMNETQGRTIDQIDFTGDADTAAAPKLVAITLEDYAGELDADPAAACWRYRKEMERALGSAVAMASAFRAFSMARESEPEELTPDERTRAEAWLAAVPRAHAAGVDGLGPAPTAWFEVRALRPDTPMTPRRHLKIEQGNLFKIRCSFVEDVPRN